MEDQALIEQAIDKAFEAQVKGIYQALSQNIVIAAGDEAKLADAKEKFTLAIAHAKQVKAAAQSSL
ncbi:hypothetical protein [Thalassotalea agarivorans]|uniref:Uncharacterized protein n=1 Tax=Thalassotalea agarivorans TaxID=349064 RepID=A0A1I0CS21_THASX|nr:hypothetical protein [Thalassotalea agarivorans]SET22369.1 hypothetical protein SAMN05660429_01305 [Thalassotalea agarivorans]